MTPLIQAATMLALAAIAAPDAAIAQDMLGGVPVIDKLDVNTLPRGKLTTYWFKAAETNNGQWLYVPVIVARGAEDGKRLLLNSGIHGDELNGIRVVQLVMADIDVTKLKGTVIGIPGLNVSGSLHANRQMYLSADGGALVDLNRNMPGDEAKGNNGIRFDGRVWNRLWAGNVDLVIDMHTQSTGTAYPLYVWADVRLDGVQKIAEALNPDVIKYDPGDKGTVETEFDRAKIPAVTFELGRAKTWQHDLILRAVSGINRVMVAEGMLAPPAATPATLQKPFIGNETTSINASSGGFVELHVALLDKVTKGQSIATQMNPFGAVVKEYTAPQDGLVLAIGDEPTREPGSLIVRLIHWNPQDSCKQGC